MSQQSPFEVLHQPVERLIVATRQSFLDVRSQIRRTVIRKIVLGTLVVSALISGIFLWFDYHEVAERQRAFLAAEASDLARVISAMAEHNVFEHNDGDAREQTFAQLAAADFNTIGFGETGEVLIAYQEDGMLHHVVASRFSGLLPPDERLREGVVDPFTAAFAGQSGQVEAVDYRGERVVAAFAPVLIHDLAVIVKMDRKEARAPFVFLVFQTIAIVGITAFAVMWLSVMASRPIVNHVQQYADAMEVLSGELVRSNDELARFAYVASHDLRAPLRGLAQLANWIEEDIGDAASADTARHLELVRSRTHRMEGMLSGLLAYAEVGRADEQVEDVDVGALLTELADLYATKPNISLQVMAGMPTIRTARAPLELVFRNLISNAIEHHDKDMIEILAVAIEGSGAIVFDISDDGTGIESRYQDKIFDIFETLKSRDVMETTGMGLALVKKTLTLRGGDITVISNPAVERGTTFRFRWPTSSIRWPKDGMMPDVGNGVVE